MAQMKSNPLHDKAYSLMLKGMVRDDGKDVHLFFKVGDSKPAIGANGLGTDGKAFTQPFVSFHDLQHMLNEAEMLINFPGEVKIAKTFKIMRASKGGTLVHSGTDVIISRRKDGLISLRFEARNIREAIFPLLLDKTMTVETRVEGGEPRDIRESYRSQAMTYIEFIRRSADCWKNELNIAGNIAEKERLNEYFNGSNKFG